MFLRQLFLLVSVFINAISCDCRQSYMTICDSFEDFEKLRYVEAVSELMIGSANGKTNMTSVSLMHVLELNKFNKLTNLVILRAVNKLEMTYAFECTYRDSPLQYFTMYGNELHEIEEYHFPVMALKKMSLVNNKIESIKTGAFDNHEIENLDLSDNLLETLESRALPSTSVTKTFIIRNNNLAYIDPGSLPPSLESLNLDHNKLRFIQNEAVANLRNLKELSLTHNKFDKMPPIQHMTELVIFDIAHNRIETVQESTFSNMEKLQFLDLSNNKISNPSILRWLATPRNSNLMTISLAYNGLQNLDVENVSLEHKTLVLHGNPWSCKSWNQLKKNIIGHESKCDVEISSTGRTPSCFDFVRHEYFLSNKWEEDLRRFQDTVRNSTASSECELTPRRYDFIHRISYGCVA